MGDGRPNQGGKLRRNGAATSGGRGGTAGHRNISDYVMGAGVVGTSDPFGGGWRLQAWTLVPEPQGILVMGVWTFSGPPGLLCGCLLWGG